MSGRSPATGSRLDLLSSGEELSQVPAGIIAMSWAVEIYRDPPVVFYHLADGTFREGNLLDFDLSIVDSHEGGLVFAIRNVEVEWSGTFSLGDSDLFAAASDGEPDLTVHVHSEDIPVAEYLNEQMPMLFCADLSAIEGTSIFRTPTDLEPIGDGSFEVVDWTAAGVDITKEKPTGALPLSIFEWLEQRLITSTAEVVFCDDGTGGSPTTSR